MKGISLSKGIAIGRARLCDMGPSPIKRRVDKIDKEIERLEEAMDLARKDLSDMYSESLSSCGEEEGDIFKAYLMILDDRELNRITRELIEKEGVSADWALVEFYKGYSKIFETIEDDYLRSKLRDLKNVVDNILVYLDSSRYLDLEEDSILVAENISPAMVMEDRSIGFISKEASENAHSSILARKTGKPLLKVGDSYRNLEDGDYLIVDGYEGKIIINPKAEEVEDYRLKIRRLRELDNERLKFINKRTLSRDGRPVEIYSNISSHRDMEEAFSFGAEGIGLYRTEFLYMNRRELPSEEEQFNYYRKLVEGYPSREVVIRTLDIGGDKELGYLRLPREKNPYLGCRAIRFSLERLDIFKSQLRAVLRASAYGNIKLMLPMVSTLDELREVKNLLEGIKSELRLGGFSFDQDIELGMMVEVPSVAIQGDIFAKEVDFFSIGTNDLIQYSLAVDRESDKLSHLYDEYNPGVLRLIKLIVDYGHGENIPVSICGESASNKRLIALFLAMGIDRLSLNPNLILESKEFIARQDIGEVQKELDSILSLGTGKEVREKLDRLVGKYI